MLAKNEHYEMTIHDIGTNGEGIGRIDGFTVFVEGGLPGDSLEVRMVKLKKNYGYGKLIRIIEASPARIAPHCPVFSQCGGCSLQHLDYKAQLSYKTKKVTDSLQRIGNIMDVEVLDTIGMDDPFFYRNKAQFPVGETDGKAKIGLYSARSHRITPVKNCAIQHPIMEKILTLVESFMHETNCKPYDESSHTGLIRHVVIKFGFTTNEAMVCLVINRKTLPHQKKFVEHLTQVPEVKSILLNHNMERTNVVMGKTIDILWGQPYITDYISTLKFEISPFSFFQVNPVQTKLLYEKAVEFADLKKTDIVIDAYCGIGTISLFMAQHASKVYGVEIVAEAIEDAKKNAALNSIHNVEFFVGQAETLIPILLEKDGVKPNVVVVDPPRKGCEIELLKAIVQAEPERIVYVSCDAGTLARDLKELCCGGVYRVERVQPVDCFPMTTHVETICLMSRLKNS